MEGRRPRIKPTVNLQLKRKTTPIAPVKTELSSSTNTIANDDATNVNSTSQLVFEEKPDKIPKSEQDINVKCNDTIDSQISTNESPVLEVPNENVLIAKCDEKDDNDDDDDDNEDIEIDKIKDEQQGKDPFKRPLDKPVQSSGEHEDIIFSIVVDVDQEQPRQETVTVSTSSSGHLTSKVSRQRIKPTPCFGTRRSSIQGIHSDNEDNNETIHQRRQRHLSENEKLQGAVFERNTKDSNTLSTGNSTQQLDSSNRNLDQIPPRYRKISSSEDRNTTSIIVHKRPPYRRSSNSIGDKTQMKMLDYIYYNPTTNPMTSQSQLNKEESVDNPKTLSSTSEKENKEEEVPSSSVDEPQNDETPAVPAPQLKLGPNGEIILDQQSLTIETTAQREARQNKTILKSNILYLDENTGNNGFYHRKQRSKEWSYDETIKFYRCLQTVGTDFSAMEKLFPHRNRRELKLKFKKEEKFNLDLIDKAIMHPNIFDIDELKNELEREEKELEEKREKRKIELENHKAEIKKSKMNNRYKSKIHSTLFHDEDVFENQEINDNNDMNKKFKKLKNAGKAKRGPKPGPKPGKGLGYSNKYRNEIAEIEAYQNMVIHEQETNAQSNDMSSVDEQMLFNALIEEDNDTSVILKEEKKEPSKTEENDDSSQDIDQIMIKLVQGSLAVITSVDPNNPDDVINEIYIMRDGEISKKPLDLSQDIVNRIVTELAAMSDDEDDVQK